MKLLRLLLTGLVLTIAFAGFLFVVAISPVAQTWFGQWALSREPRVKGTFGTLSVGWSRLDVTDLRLERDGAVLTAPTLSLDLPLWTLVRERKILIRGLIAKGWRLDLTRQTDPTRPAVTESSLTSAAARSTSPAPPPALANAFRGLLVGWHWPANGTQVEAVDLEGDIEIAVPAGHSPTRVRVAIRGGGLGAGREADLAFEASALDLRLPGNSVVVHGHLTAAIDATGAFTRGALAGELSGKAGAAAGDPTWAFDLAATRDAAGEIYRVNVSRADRPLARLAARWTAATGRLSGTWRLDGRAADLSRFTPSRVWPAFALAGEGRFETDTALDRLHLAGRCETSAPDLSVLTPGLKALGPVTLAAQFDLTRTGRTLHVDQLDLALGAAEPVARLRALQSFAFEEQTGRFTLSDPPGDWLSASAHALPLAWLGGLTDAFAITAGEATGTFLIRGADGGFTLHTPSPLLATGVSLAWHGLPQAQGLDLSLALRAGHGAQGWHAEFAPLTLDRGGRRLMTIAATANRPAGEKPTTRLDGKWTADLAALAAQPGLAGLPARSASGDFSGTVSSYTDLLSHLTVVGHDPAHTLSATIRADLYADGAAAIVGPVRMAFGHDVSEMGTELNWSEGTGSRAELRLTGANVSLAHLRLLAAPLATLGASRGHQARGDTRDAVPFWGAWAGHLTVAFERLRTDDDEFVDVGGRFRIDRNSIRLDGGHAGLPQRILAQLEGSVDFDPAAESPYKLSASASFSDFDAAPFFPVSKKSGPPVIEGRFAVAGTLSGQGQDFADLLARTEEQYRFTSKGGVIRLLRTDVAQALPPPPESATGNALDSIGSAFGHLFGVKPDSIISADVAVAPTTQAVLDFRDAVLEIGYDTLVFTATRGLDRTIRLTEIALHAPEEELTGAGAIATAPGTALAGRPLRLDLRFGARGHAADLLAKAGLLNPEKDPQGYRYLDAPLHFGGTLACIDASAWRDLLVSAARPKPPAPKTPKA